MPSMVSRSSAILAADRSSLGGDGPGDEGILGAVAQLVGDFLVETFNGEDFVKRHIGDLFQRGKTFLDEHFGKFLINIHRFGEQFNEGAGFLLLLDGGVLEAHHVDGPAGQLAGKPYVLAVAPDGLGEVLFLHRDVHGVAFFVNNDRGHFRRRHGIDDELGGVVVPGNNVDALAGKLVRHHLDPGTAHADAGAHRVDAAVIGADDDFRP